MTTEKLAFVGTNTDADEDGVIGVRVDTDGALHRDSAANGGPRPTFLAPDSAGEHLYVANRPDGVGNVVAYAIDRGSGSLTRLNEVSTKGDATPCYCWVDGTDSCVLTAQYGGGTVSVLPIRADGSLGTPTTVHEHDAPERHSDGPVESHPHSIRPGPDNEYVYVPDLGADRIVVYEFDPGNGHLSPAACGSTQLHLGAGPRHLTFHPRGRYAYVINQHDSSVTVLERDAETGGLSTLETVSTLPDGFENENRAADIHVHPTGEYLYGSNRGHDSIAVFELIHGRPRLIDTVSVDGEWPRYFSIDHSGSFLFVGNTRSDAIVTFRIDDGWLEPTGHVTGIPSPTCMRFVT